MAASKGTRNAWLGTLLKALRKEQGLTQEQLARAIGVSLRSVARYEAEMKPDESVLRRVVAFARQRNSHKLAARFEKVLRAGAGDVVTTPVSPIPQTAEEATMVTAILGLMRNRHLSKPSRSKFEQIRTFTREALDDVLKRIMKDPEKAVDLGDELTRMLIFMLERQAKGEYLETPKFLLAEVRPF